MLSTSSYTGVNLGSQVVGPTTNGKLNEFGLKLLGIMSTMLSSKSPKIMRVEDLQILTYLQACLTKTNGHQYTLFGIYLVIIKYICVVK